MGIQAIVYWVVEAAKGVQAAVFEILILPPIACRLQGPHLKRGISRTPLLSGVLINVLHAIAIKHDTGQRSAKVFRVMWPFCITVN